MQAFQICFFCFVFFFLLTLPVAGHATSSPLTSTPYDSAPALAHTPFAAPTINRPGDDENPNWRPRGDATTQATTRPDLGDNSTTWRRLVTTRRHSDDWRQRDPGRDNGNGEAAKATATQPHCRQCPPHNRPSRACCTTQRPRVALSMFFFVLSFLFFFSHPILCRQCQPCPHIHTATQCLCQPPLRHALQPGPGPGFLSRIRLDLQLD